MRLKSRLKSESYPEELKENEILITSDTVVIEKGHVLGKPNSEQQAFDMIKSLSGATHTVMTAVTIKDKNKRITLEDETKVTFRFLEAGAYGIQEWIGFIGVASIEGSYFNVMGFPLHLVYEQLKKW
mgnify:CR=1 FL=1